MLASVGVSPHAPGSKDCNAALMQRQLHLTPTATLQAVFCSSKLIDALITFGAQNYLEFKLMQGRQASPEQRAWMLLSQPCFLVATCMAWLGFSLTKPLQLSPCWASGRDTAASRALCWAGSAA